MTTKKNCILSIAALLGICTGTFCNANEYSENNDPLTIDVGYTGEFLWNLSGGIQRGDAYLDNLDLIIDIDADRLWGVPNSNVFLYGLYNNGAKFSESIVGDLQVISNIETGVQAARLYEAWVNIDISRRSQLLFGLFDLNSEFDVLESSQLLVNSAFGIGTDISQAGLNGPSIFPVTGLAARYAMDFGDNWALRIAVIDGVPGDPEDPGATTIELGADEGALIVGELQWDTGKERVLLGMWGYTAKFEEDPLGIGDAGADDTRGNSGIYVRGESVLYDNSSTLSVFGRYGYAFGDFNIFEHFLSAGLHWQPMFPGRPEDEIGLGFAWAETSETAQDLGAQYLIPLDSREIVIEFTYRSQLFDRVAIQPHVQYVINPGLDPTLDNALVAGLRFELDVW